MEKLNDIIDFYLVDSVIEDFFERFPLEWLISKKDCAYFDKGRSSIFNDTYHVRFKIPPFEAYIVNQRYILEDKSEHNYLAININNIDIYKEVFCKKTICTCNTNLEVRDIVYDYMEFLKEFSTKNKIIIELNCNVVLNKITFKFYKDNYDIYDLFLQNKDENKDLPYLTISFAL